LGPPPTEAEEEGIGLGAAEWLAWEEALEARVRRRGEVVRTSIELSWCDPFGRGIGLVCVLLALLPLDRDVVAEVAPLMPMFMFMFIWAMCACTSGLVTEPAPPPPPRAELDAAEPEDKDTWSTTSRPRPWPWCWCMEREDTPALVSSSPRPP